MKITTRKEETPRSPLGPLEKMEDCLEEFSHRMLRVQDYLKETSRIYNDLTALREVAQSNAEETNAHLRNMLDEHALLIDEHAEQEAQLTALRAENDALKARIEDLERQTEKRYFNVELRTQNEAMLAQIEEMKRSRKKDLDQRAAETRTTIFDTVREALNESDKLAMRYGTQNEWIHTLDRMRTMFRKLPEVTQHIDDLLTQHLNQPVPQANSITEIHVSDNEHVSINPNLQSIKHNPT